MRDNEHFIHPFDLHVPERVLIPLYSPMREWNARMKTTRLHLGTGDYTGTLLRDRYEDGTTKWYVEVECDDAPHCGSCECSTKHYVYLTDEQVVQLRQFLGT
jgi:hypothetical protein